MFTYCTRVISKSAGFSELVYIIQKWKPDIQPMTQHHGEYSKQTNKLFIALQCDGLASLCKYTI